MPRSLRFDTIPGLSRLRVTIAVVLTSLVLSGVATIVAHGQLHAQPRHAAQRLDNSHEGLPTIDLQAPLAAVVGAPVRFKVVSSNATSLSWDFGDGTPPSAPANTAAASHTYSAPGRRTVIVTATNARGTTTHSAAVIVHHPLMSPAPAASSPIIHTGTHVLNVNPDQGTVAAISEAGLTRVWEMPVGANPRTLAAAPNGEIWVVNQGDATVHVLRPSDGAHVRTIALPYASQPYGIVFAPDGSAAYVTLQATHKLLKLNLTGEVVGTIALDGPPRGLAAVGDRLLVTRFVSPADRADVWNVDAAAWHLIGTLPLAYDTTPDSEENGRGVPNYLTTLCISPDGRRALVPSKKDNTARGVFRTGQGLEFDTRTRTIVSFIDLIGDAEDYGARIDLDDHNMAQSVVFSPHGDLFFVATQGTNTILIYDANAHTLLGELKTGLTPQGMVLSASGHRLYVHNFMSRSVSVFDTRNLVNASSQTAPLLSEITTVAAEMLAAHVLRGKQIFYNAADRRMSRNGYISCAGCHLDGGSDGQVWDFTQAGEGLRRTTSLIGRAGTGHGNVHWTANFDEIQDFENDIRNAFAGRGFLSNADFAATSDPLGAPKAGLSPELDALAAYVSSLDRFPNSPYRNPDGTLSADGAAGRSIFQAKNCASCHSGARFTDGRRHDVGTIQPSSGKGLGQPLEGVGFDTPTLKGLWSNAPYLHNGQAATLEDVLDNSLHGGTHTLTAAERSQLVAYLLQIDDLEEAVEPAPHTGRGGILVARESSWKYHDQGQNLGTAWRALAYDDATWASGPGVLGYGESYVATEVSYGGSSSTKHPTSYFRRAFTVTGAAGVTALKLRIMWDDGFAAYLNGVEVARRDMGSGPVGYATWATTSHEANASYEEIDLGHAIAMLLDGDNVLAVEVHQKNSTSSDMIFDAELVSEGSGVPMSGLLVARKSNWKYHDHGQDLGEAWRALGHDDESWASGPGVLGYGESYVATVVSYGESSSNKHPTTYFRRTFAVSGAADRTGLTLRMMWDDGFVAYLNGVEVARRNLAGGPVGFATWANSSHEANNSYEEMDIGQAIGALVDGVNVLAIEVHQKDGGSSDMIFDAELESNGPTLAALAAATDARARDELLAQPPATPQLNAWPVPYRNGSLTIAFSTGSSRAEAEPVDVAIFDLEGRRVRALANGHFRAGVHRVTWDGRDAAGAPVTAGVYFLKVQSGAHGVVRKIVTVR